MGPKNFCFVLSALDLSKEPSTWVLCLKIHTFFGQCLGPRWSDRENRSCVACNESLFPLIGSIERLVRANGSSKSNHWNCKTSVPTLSQDLSSCSLERLSLFLLKNIDITQGKTTWVLCTLHYRIENFPKKSNICDCESTQWTSLWGRGSSLVSLSNIIWEPALWHIIWEGPYLRLPPSVSFLTPTWKSGLLKLCSRKSVKRSNFINRYQSIWTAFNGQMGAPGSRSLLEDCSTVSLFLQSRNGPRGHSIS